MKLPEAVEGDAKGEHKAAAEEGGEDKEKVNLDLSSDEEEVEIEETIEESRAERIKRSSLQRVQNIKTVFSKDKMEKTKQKTKDNYEKTKQKTKDNLEKTRMKTKENLEKNQAEDQGESWEDQTEDQGEPGENTSQHREKDGQTRQSNVCEPWAQREAQVLAEEYDEVFTPDHTIYARSKTAVYKVPPFTFHVKRSVKEKWRSREPRWWKSVGMQRRWRMQWWRE